MINYSSLNNCKYNLFKFSSFHFSNLNYSILRSNQNIIVNELNNITENSRIGIVIPRRNLSKTVCNSFKLMYKESGNLYKKLQLLGGESYMNFDEDLLYYSFNFYNKSNKETLDLIDEIINSIYNEKIENNNNNEILNQKLEIYKLFNQINPNNEDNEFFDFLYQREKEKDNTKIDIKQLNKIIKDFIQTSPKNIFITSGLINSNNLTDKKICETIQNKLSKYKPKEIKYTKNPLLNLKIYDKRIQLENKSITNLKLFFPTYSWNSNLILIYSILSEIIGSATPFSSGGPGKGIFSKAYTEILSNNDNILNFKTLNLPFKYYGLFGFDIIFFQKENDIIKSLCKLIKNLNNISLEEFERGKAILKRKIINSLLNNNGRVEEIAKEIFYFDNVIGYKIFDMIDKITINELKKEIKNMINKKKESILYIKGYSNDIKQIPNREKILELI